MKSRLIVLTSVFLLFFTQVVPQAESQITQRNFRFGFVNKGNNVDGDSIWLANTKKKDRVGSKAIAILSYDSSGKVNINGRDIDLKLVKANLPNKNFKVGLGGYQIWKGRNTTVRLDYVFTWLCPQNQENCSVYYYKGILDIHYNRRQRKVDILGFGGS